AGKKPDDAPPGAKALSGRPWRRPPARAMSSVAVVPRGTSYTPGFLTCPLTARNFKPGAPFFPCAAHHAPLLRRMPGTIAKVSTLFIRVGLPNSPYVPGKGGLLR